MQDTKLYAARMAMIEFARRFRMSIWVYFFTANVGMEREPRSVNRRASASC
jgi:hypothetical protein